MHIFPEDQVDENLFDLYYHPYKKQIWGIGAVIGVAVVSFLGYRELRQQKLDSQWNEYEEAMALRTPSLPGQADADQVQRQVDALRRLATENADDPIAPFALKGVVQAHVAAGDFSSALESLDELQSRYPEFALSSLPASGTDGTRSLADELRASIESEQRWQQATEYVHPEPSTERTVIIDTTMGSLQLGFYPEAAPDHVAAFVERAKRGAYNGTQFYEVRIGTDGEPDLVRAGSAASKTERDPATHDRDEPADTIEPEDSRYTIRHHFGVVSSVDMDSGESATNFQIVTAPDGMSSFDGRNTVFAAVLDREGSMETLGRIARATTYETHPDTATADGLFRMRDHPYPAVRIRRVAILTNEKVEDGHTWDVSRVGSDEPEPWEADLAADPLPEEFAGPESSDGDRAPGDGAAPDDEAPTDTAPDDGDAPEDGAGDE